MLKPFPFWVQNVLPQVYDDSLSYYELLSKVVSYLNETIGEVNKLGDSFVQLQNWVKDYFDSQDFGQMIEDTLDRMVEDGTFDQYIQTFMMGCNDITDNALDVLVKEPTDAQLEYFSQNLESMQAEDIFALYDTISDLTKHVYGSDDFGNDLVYYTYDAPIFKNAGTAFNSYKGYNDGLPYLMLVSGIHGIEKGAVSSVYLFVKELMNNKEKYSAITQNISMTIVPVANPSGFNANTYKNGNDVNLNRNFPNNFNPDYPDSGEEALDQPETAFLAYLVDTLQAEWKSGLFVVDNHEFITDNVNRMFWYNCSSQLTNYPEVRFNLMKTVGYLRNKIIKKYPILTPTEDNNDFNIFLQFGFDATFGSYFSYKGCSGFLCESMSELWDGSGRYSKDALWIDYVIRTTSIWNTVSKFKTGSKKVITSVYNLGLTPNNTLAEVIKAVPYKSTLNFMVTSDNDLYDDLPSVVANPYISIDKVLSTLAIVTVKDITTEVTSGSSVVAPQGEMQFRATFAIPSTEGATDFVKIGDWISDTPVDLLRQPSVNLTLARIIELSKMYPAQVCYCKNGGDASIPNEGLLLILKPFTTIWYNHIWLINISSGLSWVNFAHITPSSESVTWKRLAIPSE